MKKRIHHFTILAFLLILCGPVVRAQQTIRGKVTDTEQQPLVGVNVLVKGTSTGTATDASGSYSIRANRGQTLVFSYLGFVSKEIALEDQTTVDMALTADNKVLNEVVVTALGIPKERKQLGYSVTEVSGSNFTQAREINLGNALSGRVAGVNATSTATGPGGSSRVIIRGNGSLNGNTQPLYVVNGVPIDNSNLGSAGEWGGTDRGDGLISINPDDIESISVLKGGTAAALYGSRAANGVILITTKSGKGQQGIGVELNSTYTQERPLTFTDWQYEYGSGTRGQKPTTQDEAVQNGLNSWGSRLDGSPVVQFDGVSRPYSAQKNNVKNFYDNGSTFTNTVAVSGGNENANFRFSASNLDTKSMVPNSSINRKTFALSANGNLMKRVVFASSFQYAIEETKNRSFLSDSPRNPNYSAQLLATNVDIRNLNPGYDAQGYEVRFNSNVYATNPYFAVNKVQNFDSRNRLFGSFSLRYNITNSIYIRGRLGTDYYTTSFTDIEPTGLAYFTGGKMTQGQQKFFENNAEVIAGVDKTFGKFSLNAILGGNQMTRLKQEFRGNGNTFNVPFNYFLDNLVNRDPTTLVYENQSINSLFGSADIGYNGYLFLSLTGRQDWFSTLSPRQNNLFYPSVGLSFVFSDALQMPAWLNYGKVRASWAQVGGGYPEPYLLNLTYKQPGQHLGQPLMNINGGTIPNANLKPYTSTTTEVGLELKTLDNRLGLDLALYNRVTTDDQVKASTSLSSGYSDVLVNVGKVQNRGIEVLLTGTPIRQTNFGWEVSYNVAYNQNKVVRISDDLKTLYLGQARTQNGYVYNDEGQPFGLIKGYQEKRDENGNIVYNRATGVPLQSELAVLGRGVPPVTMGLTNTFHYKNFTLSFLIDGKFGAKMYSATNAYGTFFGLHKNTLQGREGGVQVRGVDARGAEFDSTISAQSYYQGVAFRITDRFVYDADFIKLRQLTFGYSLPKRLLAKTPFQFISLSFVARNLLLIHSKVPNVDPESSYSNGATQGLEMFGVPPARSYGLNLMVKF